MVYMYTSQGRAGSLPEDNVRGALPLIRCLHELWGWKGSLRILSLSLRRCLHLGKHKHMSRKRAADLTREPDQLKGAR